MKVLLIGGGGREHAMAWKLRQSKKLTKLYAAPGNGGISEIAECAQIKATDTDALLGFALKNQIDFTVVGPDDPLALGVTDRFETAGLKVFGPRKNAAEIEYSKVFSKNFMRKHKIPTARCEVFSSRDEALKYLSGADFPAVIKADGLSLGKGVFICPDLRSAEEAIDAVMLEKKFGDSGNSVIIEEYLSGPEITVLAFCDGKNFVTLPPSQDHKRARDNDEGPNTGGMGAVCPVGLYTSELEKTCFEKIYEPTMHGLVNEGRPFSGMLYFSLMLTENGPKVIEYNARFGDPEAQALLPLLKTDLLDIMTACADGSLDKIKIEWEDAACASVVVASGGYPLKYSTGYEINGLDNFIGSDDIIIFHAGTSFKNGKFYTAGGRVLAVTAKAGSLETAVSKAYAAAEKISFTDAYYRTDIGKKLLV